MTAQELKNSILQLAMQGKLVPHTNENASELLEKIKKSHADSGPLRGSLKNKKGMSVGLPNPCDNKNTIAEDEKPFDIPENWCWCRLGEICYEIKRGKSPKYVDKSNYLAFAQKCNVKTGGINLDLALYLDESTISRYSGSDNMIQGDVVINSTGGGTMGRVGFYECKVPENIKGVYPDSHVTVIRSIGEISQKYLYFFLKSKQAELEKMGAGSTNQTELKPATLQNLPIPLPPLSEQKAIVAKIEELLPYIEKYDDAYTKLEEFNKKFPEDMQKSILQQAVQGKLIIDNGELKIEETGAQLLERIRSEKQKLIAQGKIKKEKDLPPITEDEIPFEIPENWCWCRLGEIAEIARGGSPRPINDYLTEAENGLNWIKISDTDKGGKYINSTKQKIKPEGLVKTRLIHKGDFLLTNSMSFGRPYISNIEGCIHDGWLVISPIKGIFETDYLYYLLSSRFIYYQFVESAAGAVVQNLNSDKVRETIVAVPPLAEQKAIVAKIEELLPLCRKLIK